MVDGARHIKSNKVTRSVPAYSAVKGEKTPIVAQIVLVNTAENNVGILFERQKHLWEIDLFVFFFLSPWLVLWMPKQGLNKKIRYEFVILD